MRFTLVVLATVFLVISYGGLVYWQTQSIEDPKKCFTTKMFEVYLCPGSSQYVSYSQVPKHFFQALVLSEDASFWSHEGFDWFEIKESFRRNIMEWKYARGGSTLTQQLAKNLYLTPSKSLSRKFKEFFIAKQIEEKLSKAQILEKYINVVEFGKNIYGLKKAANHYFGKSPANLNLLESVYLVSLLPSPRRLGRSFNSKKLSSNNIWRMEIILKRMNRTNKIDSEQFSYLNKLINEFDWPFYQYDLAPTPMTPPPEESQNLEFSNQELDEAQTSSLKESESDNNEGGAEKLESKDEESSVIEEELKEEAQSIQPKDEESTASEESRKPTPEEDSNENQDEGTPFEYPEK